MNVVNLKPCRVLKAIKLKKATGIVNNVDTLIKQTSIYIEIFSCNFFWR